MTYPPANYSHPNGFPMSRFRLCLILSALFLLGGYSKQEASLPPSFEAPKELTTLISTAGNKLRYVITEGPASSSRPSRTLASRSYDHVERDPLELSLIHI